MQPARLLLPMTLTILVCACAAERQPIPPGTIPDYQPSSTADKGHGRRVFQELRSQYALDQNEADHQRVDQIVERLSRAAGAESADWQIHIFRDDRVINAAATKGEQIFIWSGMLKAVHDDHELASVIAHEMGHVLAGHTTPTAQEEAGRILVEIGKVSTQSVIGSQGYMGYGAALAGNLAGNLIRAAAVNPESQREEFEADQIGIFLLARAGYNPARAIEFWQNAQTNLKLPAEGFNMFSSHPSSRARVERLKSSLPAAMRIYQQNPINDSFNVGPEDSFSINRPAADDSPPERPAQPLWIVQAEYAPVFAAPDEQSEVRGFLYFNQAVLVEALDPPWARISKPIRGYLQSTGLAPKD